MRNKKGFTLIEVIVVVAIIAILLILLVPAITGYLRHTREVACAGNLATINKEYLLQLATHPQAKQQGEYEAMLDGAMQEHKATLTGALCYEGICPSGGVVHGLIGPFGSLELYCSIHGVSQENDFIPYRLSQSTALQAYFNDRLGANKLKQGYALNSEARFQNAAASAIWDDLEKQGILRNENSWRVYVKSSKGTLDTAEVYNIFWSYQNIGGLKVGDAISVTRYDVLTGTYVKGTAKVAQTDDGSAGQYYNIISGESFVPDETP